MQQSQSTVQHGDCTLHILCTSKHPPQTATVPLHAPRENQQQNKNQKGSKQVDSQQSAQKSVSKAVQPVNSGRDSESSHRLSFLLQAAHLTRGMSSSLSR
jgi:hypothetical protein